jgi:hypothetical protein
MNEVDTFIEIYNAYLKLKMTDFPDVELIKRKNVKSVDGLINYFLSAFEFPPVYNYSGFCFIDGTDEAPDDLVHFATHTDYNTFYVWNPDNDRVVLWSFETGDIEWACAKDPVIFFTAMTEVMKTKIKMIETQNRELDNQYLLGVYEYCMDLNGNNDECSIFYEHILGIYPVSDLQ